MADQPEQPAYEPNEDQITFFGQANFRSAEHRFGIKRSDRRRHMYVIGKTGMGKSTMLENMIIQDIQNGEGLAVVDPHGDLVEKVIDYVPSHRINDVVYINPADLDYPIAFNILENVEPEYRNLVSNGLVGVFKKIWADSWGPRLEYILINTILALLEYPGSTLLGVMRMLVDTKYRRKVVRKITDPVVRSFWVNEFNNYSEKFRNEAIAPIQNKIGQFLSSSLIRNIVGQVRSTIDMRELMDSGKIVVMNLSKGRIGEENSALLGAMMITKIQLAAMSRVDIPEHTRRDFYLYVDEFQNFSTDSFAGILSEARKYHLNIIMAHQYIEQLTDEVRAAVFGNVGTMTSFRVGATDAEELEKEFTPTFTQEDIVTLPAYQIYLRLMIDGVASEPFSANTLPPISEPTGNRDKVIRVSRERYAGNREKVEEDILRWSGDEDNLPPAVKKMDKKKEDEKAPKQEQKTQPQKPTPVPPPPPPPPRQDELKDLRQKGLSFVEAAQVEEPKETNSKAKKSDATKPSEQSESQEQERKKNTRPSDSERKKGEQKKSQDTNKRSTQQKDGEGGQQRKRRRRKRKRSDRGQAGGGTPQKNEQKSADRGKNETRKRRDRSADTQKSTPKDSQRSSNNQQRNQRRDRDQESGQEKQPKKPQQQRAQPQHGSRERDQQQKKPAPQQVQPGQAIRFDE